MNRYTMQPMVKLKLFTIQSLPQHCLHYVIHNPIHPEVKFIIYCSSKELIENKFLPVKTPTTLVSWELQHLFNTQTF